MSAPATSSPITAGQPPRAEPDRRRGLSRRHRPGRRLAARAGAAYRPWFRYPFLDEGTRRGAEPTARDAVRAGLAERRLAQRLRHRRQLRLVSRRSRQPRPRRRPGDGHGRRCATSMSRSSSTPPNSPTGSRSATLGRRPVQVALMHETDLEAMFLPDAIAALRRRGWRDRDHGPGLSRPDRPSDAGGPLSRRRPPHRHRQRRRPAPKRARPRRSTRRRRSCGCSTSGFCGQRRH